MQLYYREFGQGDPIIILHGMFGFSDNWQTIAKALADHYLVITPDLRNHGRSPHVPTHTYAEMAEDVRQFMAQYGMYSSTLVGHSMGGKVAMQLALDHPDQVERLVVVDIAPTQADDNNQAVFQALNAVDLSSMTTRQDIEAILAPFLPDVGVRQFLLKNVTRDAEGHFAWKMNLPVIRAHYAEILAGVQSQHPYDGPTLFVRGARSPYVRDTDWPAIQKYFPRATLVTIPDAGHWVHADQPEALLAAMRKFMELA